MLARDLVQLSVLVTRHGPLLVEAGGEIDPRRLGEYWSISKCRMERWTRSLKTFKFVTAAQRDTLPGGVHLPALLTEILTGEVLTRAWSAVLCAHDRQRGVREAEPIARSIFLGHLEARNRALHLLLDGAAISLKQTVAVDRLRRRAERWSDLLVARMMAWGESGEYAVDRRRAEELAGVVEPHAEATIWAAVFASVHAAAQEIPREPSPNADINAELASSIVGCFPARMFDGAGVLPNLNWLRMTRVADETQGLLKALLADECRPSEGSVGDARPTSGVLRDRRSQRRF